MTIKASSRSVPEVEHSAASALAASDRRLRNEVRGGYQSGLGVIRSLSDSGACRTSARHQISAAATWLTSSTDQARQVGEHPSHLIEDCDEIDSHACKVESTARPRGDLKWDVRLPSPSNQEGSPMIRSCLTFDG